MAEHFSAATQSIAAWCGDCGTHTQHRVEGHVATNVCIPCQEKAEAERKERGTYFASAGPRQQQIAVTTFLEWETGKVHA